MKHAPYMTSIANVLPCSEKVCKEARVGGGGKNDRQRRIAGRSLPLFVHATFRGRPMVPAPSHRGHSFFLCVTLSQVFPCFRAKQLTIHQSFPTVRGCLLVQAHRSGIILMLCTLHPCFSSNCSLNRPTLRSIRLPFTVNVLNCRQVEVSFAILQQLAP